jgi:hypothetical protein
MYVQRLVAEQVYMTSFYESTRKQDDICRNISQDLRTEFEEVKEYREDYLAALDDDGLNEYDMDGEGHEEQDEVAAETFDLVICSTSEDPKSADLNAIVRVLNVIPPIEDATSSAPGPTTKSHVLIKLDYSN